MSERIAVMDLGTNTFHLLIAETKNGAPEVIYRDRRPVKIGKGGINHRTILPDAVLRAVECMKAFRQQLDEWRVTRFRALGTSALRDATNGSAVVQAIRDATGIEVEVISGQEEADYIYYGIRSAMNLGETPSLIVDIGGGSVEFIIANATRVFWKVSLDIGAQRLLERYHRHDPLTEGERSELDKHYQEALNPVTEAISIWQPRTLIGSSGTFDTLSEIYCVDQGIPYEPEKAETPLTVPAFKAIHQKLITRNRAERMRIPGMIELRVDMIVVASCLIQYLVDSFLFEQIRVSSYSLKEGILSTMSEHP